MARVARPLRLARTPGVHEVHVRRSDYSWSFLNIIICLPFQTHAVYSCRHSHPQPPHSPIGECSSQPGALPRFEHVVSLFSLRLPMLCSSMNSTGRSTGRCHACSHRRRTQRRRRHRLACRARQSGQSTVGGVRGGAVEGRELNQGDARVPQGVCALKNPGHQGMRVLSNAGIPTSTVRG